MDAIDFVPPAIFIMALFCFGKGGGTKTKQEKVEKTNGSNRGESRDGMHACGAHETSTSQTILFRDPPYYHPVVLRDEQCATVARKLCAPEPRQEAVLELPREHGTDARDGVDGEHNEVRAARVRVCIGTKRRVRHSVSIE